MPLPNFLIVGTPKAGTTAIYNYLNQHPQIYLPSFKEPHFFSFEGESKPHWGINTLEEYSQLFEGVSHEKAIGEASTWYLYSQTAAQRIKHHIPDVKLIAILRNPVDRAYSSWGFRVQSSWEPITDFKKAIEAQRTKNRSGWDFDYLNVGFYYIQLKRYFDLFSRDQIRVYLYEDFKKDAMAVIQDIFAFINVEDSFKPNISVQHNVTKMTTNQWLNKFLSRQSGVKSLVKELVPSVIKEQLSTQVRTANQFKLPPLSSVVRQEILEMYKDDISNLEKLLERDLSTWL
ncbi:MAG: sulfotransferase [Cyanobacteria bacterium P01_D01_bin.50]